MAIDGGLRKSLVAGTVLAARHKGTRYTATVDQTEDGKTRYRLEDGRVFTSPSAAGSAVMGGTSCNGWRFWSLAGTEETAAAKPKASKPKGAKAGTPKAAAPYPGNSRAARQLVRLGAKHAAAAAPEAPQSAPEAATAETVVPGVAEGAAE